MGDGSQLNLERCPHCGIAKPFLSHQFDKDNKKGAWSVYECQSCGGMVLTLYERHIGVEKTWPKSFSISESVPERARAYLTEAVASLHAPSGAVMLTASAVDAMLKNKGYKQGDLYARINAAKNDHLITPEMATWAHEIRLDANEQRHADDLAPLANKEDAERSLNFAMALCQFMYVLPATVADGRKQKAAQTGDPEKPAENAPGGRPGIRPTIKKAE